MAHEEKEKEGWIKVEREATRTGRDWLKRLKKKKRLITNYFILAVS